MSWYHFFASTASGEGIAQMAEQVTEKIQKNEVDGDQLTKWLKTLGDWAVSFAGKLLIALLIFLIGRKLLKFLIKVIKRSLARTNTDEGVINFITSMGKVLGNIVLITIIAAYMGIETSSFVAIIGSAGLTIGLALQGSLANFAGGVLILVMKPFKMGDYIILPDHEGEVCGIDIFYTKLMTVDNRLIVIPNGTMANSSIINATKEDDRRLDIEVGISYSENIQKVKKILMDIVDREDKILRDKGISIMVKELASSSVTMGVRVWVETDNYWALRWDMMEKIKLAFDDNNIEIPYNQLDVHVTQSVSDPEGK